MATRLLAVAPLADVLGSAPRLFVAESGLRRRVHAVTDALTDAMGLPALAVHKVDRGDSTSYEHAIGALLDPEGAVWDHIDSRPSSLSSLQEVAQGVRAMSLRDDGVARLVDRGPGARLSTFDWGARSGPVVVLISAPGMPIELSEAWLKQLGRRHRVLSWETPFLFGTVSNFDDQECSLVSQAADLVRVLDRQGVTRAHVVGLCGGAALAAVAASHHRERVLTLSLLHGDFNMGAECARTRHQGDVLALMRGCASTRSKAAIYHNMFKRPDALTNLPERMGHLLLYPYATPEWLFRYARLNGEIMRTDLRPFVSAIAARTLVIASTADSTAHPAGSQAVAALCAQARLELGIQGKHLDAFNAPAMYLELVESHVAAAAV